MSTYLGLDVLDQVNHNMRESIGQAFERHGQLTVNPSGRKQWDEYAGRPLTVRSFEWGATTRAEIAQLRAFLLARQGRLVPFWTPTWCWNLTMRADALAAAAAIRIAKVGYGQYIWPNFLERRDLAITSPSGGLILRRVTLVTDNGDGTETLSLSAGLGVDLKASRALVSYLTLCRLDIDEPELRWYGLTSCEATLPFREVPKEVP